MNFRFFGANVKTGLHSHRPSGSHGSLVAGKTCHVTIVVPTDVRLSSMMSLRCIFVQKTTFTLPTAAGYSVGNIGECIDNF